MALAALGLAWAGTVTAAECDDRKGGYVLPKVAGSDTAIVFVHGLGGHAWDTWRGADAPASWPCLLRADPSFEKANLYLYGYGTGIFGDQPSIPEVAQNLAHAVRPVLDEHPQVVFIVHSMGGLVTAQALMSLGDPELLKRVQLVMFYGTPGSGSALAALAERAQLPLQLVELSPGNTTVNQLMARWRDARRMQAVSRCFAEARAPGGLLARTVGSWVMALIGSPGGVVVDTDSAKAPCGGRGRVLDATDHFTIVKPAGVPTQHPAYRQLVDHAGACLRPARVAGRSASLAGRPEAAAARRWRLRMAELQALPPGPEREAGLTAMLALDDSGTLAADGFVVPRDAAAEQPSFRNGWIPRRAFLQWIGDQPLATPQQRQIDIVPARHASDILFNGLARERIEGLLAEGVLQHEDHLVLVDSPAAENQQLLLLLAGRATGDARLKGFLVIDSRPGCEH